MTRHLILCGGLAPFQGENGQNTNSLSTTCPAGSTCALSSFDAKWSRISPTTSLIFLR